MSMASFTAIIGANIRQFQSRIREAQREAQRFQLTNITAQITARINEFRARMAQARAQLNQFARSEAVVEIRARLTDFTAGLLRARALAQQFSRNEIIARITADTRRFMNRLTVARMAASAFIRDRIEATLDIDTSQFTARIAAARAVASAFVRDRITTVISVNTARFTTALANARAQASAFVRNRIVANIRANTSQFVSQLTMARMMASAFVRNRITAVVDASTSRFFSALARVRTAMNAINGRNIIIEIEARIERFQQTIGRIASNIRAFSELMGNTLRGAFLSLSSTAAPVLASLGALIGSLGPMIGTVAGSTFALVTAFAAAGAAAVAFGAIAIPTIKKLFDENEKLNAVQKKAKASFTAFGNTWKGITKDLEKPVLQAFTTGMQAANQMLKMSQPLFASATKAMNNLMTSLKQSLGTPPVQAFFDYLNKDAGPLLEVTGKAAGNLFKGLMSMMTAFGPLAMNTANGFLQMSRNFSTWAAGLSKSEKFQSFVSYINENMPKIKAIFRDALAGVTYFFAAFGDLSSDMMTKLQSLMARFKAWSASLSENKGFQNFISYVRDNAPNVMSLIGNLTKFLVNLGIGLAPLGSKLLELTNKFLGWVNSMMTAHPVIGQIISLLTLVAGALIAIVPNIIAFSTLFSGLGTVIMGGLGKALSFIRPLFTSIGATIARILPFIMNLGMRALPLLASAFGFLVSPVGIAIAAIAGIIAVLVAVYKNNEQFRNQVQTIWSGIQEFITAAMTKIKSVVTFIWPGIQAIITAAWTAIQTVITSSLNIILGFVQVFSALFKGNWQGVWEGIKQIAAGAMQILHSIIKLGFDLFMAPINVFGGKAKSVISSAWDAIKNVFNNTLNAIKNIVKAGFDAIKNIAKSVMDGIKSIIQTVWNAIKSVITSVLNAIKSVVTSIWNAIKSTITSVMNAIKSAVTSAWNAIKSAVTSSLNAIKSVVTSSWNAIKSVVTSTMNGIKSVVTSAWSAISSVVSSRVSAIYSTVVSKFNALKSAVASAMTGVKTAIVNGWNAAKSFLSSINLSGIGRNIIQGLINGIGSMMGAVRAKIQSIANTIKNGIKSALSIHSPSRVMRDEVGVWIPAGIAAGMDKNIGVIKQAANNMAQAATPNLASVKKLIKEFNDFLVSSNVTASNEIKQIKKKATEEIKKVQTTAEKDIAAIEKGAKDRRRKLTATEVRRIEKIEETSAERIKNLRKKEAADIAKIDKNLAKERLSAVETFVTNKKQLEQLTAVEEVKIWEEALKKFKANTDERRAAELKLRDAKLVIYNELKKASDDYLSKVQEVNQKLIEDEKELRDVYQKSVDDRTAALVGFAGTFEEVARKESVASQSLIDNLKNQVSIMSDWAKNMQALAARGIDDGLLAELQAMGPKALAETEALLSMSDVQLNEFQSLWKEKASIARQQAVAEMEGLRAETERKIEELRINAKKQLDLLKVEFVNKVKELRNGSTNEFNIMAASLPAIGKHAIQGLINGMNAMKGSLAAKAKELADSVRSTIQSAFDIHSPSRWMRDVIGKNLVSGLIVGIDSMESKALAATKRMAGWLKPQLSDVDISRSSLDVGLQMDELKRQIDQKLDVDLWIHQKEGKAAAGFKQEVHLHSPTALSPSENARALKKVGQQQAIEWGV